CDTTFWLFVGFNIEPSREFVVTPDGQDNLKLTLQTIPVHASGDQVKVEFKVQPNYFYNGTRCAEFSTVVFDRANWQVPQKLTYRLLIMVDAHTQLLQSVVDMIGII
ncbi:unnamed protein product, partial [Rotaria sp. Silwood2]